MWNERQFVDFYHATYHQVLRYIVSRCSSAADVADLVQDTYLRFYKQACGKDERIDHPQRYLLRIARNVLYRSYGPFAMLRQSIPVFSPGDGEDYENLELTFLSEEASPDDAALCDEIWTYLRDGDTLTYRIFALYFIEDMTFSQIAAQLRLKETMVKSRFYRTLKKLQKMFSDSKQEGSKADEKARDHPPRSAAKYSG